MLMKKVSSGTVLFQHGSASKAEVHTTSPQVRLHTVRWPSAVIQALCRGESVTRRRGDDQVWLVLPQHLYHLILSLRTRQVPAGAKIKRPSGSKSHLRGHCSDARWGVELCNMRCRIDLSQGFLLDFGCCRRALGEDGGLNLVRCCPAALPLAQQEPSVNNSVPALWSRKQAHPIRIDLRGNVARRWLVGVDSAVVEDDVIDADLSHTSGLSNKLFEHTPRVKEVQAVAPASSLEQRHTSPWPAHSWCRCLLPVVDVVELRAVLESAERTPHPGEVVQRPDGLLQAVVAEVPPASDPRGAGRHGGFLQLITLFPGQVLHFRRETETVPEAAADKDAAAVLQLFIEAADPLEQRPGPERGTGKQPGRRDRRTFSRNSREQVAPG